MRVYLRQGGGFLAELTVFGYRPGNSLLHRLDPRTKLAGVAVCGLVGVAGALPATALTGLLILVLLQRAGVGPRQWAKDLRIFWLMLAMVFIARALTGAGPPLVQIVGTGPTTEGMAAGAMICLRLAVVALAGVGLSVATRPSELEAAVQRVLRPVPFVPERRLATMLGLVVRFLPDVLREARLTREAQAARGVELRKNPLARMALFAVPMLRRTFARADRLALAMEARCYSDRRTGPELRAGLRDGICLFGLGALCLLSLL